MLSAPVLKGRLGNGCLHYQNLISDINP
jgi:hypothetical protein